MLRLLLGIAVVFMLADVFPGCGSPPRPSQDADTHDASE